MEDNSLGSLDPEIRGGCFPYGFWQEFKALYKLAWPLVRHTYLLLQGPKCNYSILLYKMDVDIYNIIFKPLSFVQSTLG